MQKTEQFLRAAFAGESQTNRKYLAFAAKADEEGYSQVARLFRGAAESETVHAHNFLRVLKEIHSTRENLKEAISSETNAFQNRYPEMIEVAKEEGDKEAERLFHYALESEKSTSSFLRGCWIPLKRPKRTIHITSAMAAVIPRKGNHRKPAPCAIAGGRCIEK